MVAEICKEKGRECEYLQEVGSLLTENVYALANNVYRTIDFEAMENNEKFVIKYGLKAELDNAKKKFNILPKTIDAVTPYEFNIVPNYIQEINMVYIPEMRFLLSIPYWKQNLTQNELMLPNLEFKFTANKVAYYKSKRCKEMDKLLGDPQLEIMQEESEIILELLRFIGENLPYLIKLLNKVMELDCILSLGSLANELDFKRPLLTEEKCIKIVNGVNPLLSMKVENYIPNDYHSSHSQSVILLTGPSSSGKSVYLRQVALICYLAHIGSFLPADEAIIGVLNSIYLITPTSESITLKMSTFLSELRKVSGAVWMAGQGSLVLIDELGRGTCDTSGRALLSALLGHVAALPSAAKPHLLVATLRSDPLPSPLTNHPSLTHIALQCVSSDSKCTFLYKLCNGAAEFSSALEISRHAGLAEHTINAAKEVLNAMRTGLSVYPYSLNRVKRWQRYYKFIKTFSSIDMKKPNYLDKLKRKVILFNSKR